MDNIGYDIVEDQAGLLFTPTIKGVSNAITEVKDVLSDEVCITPNPAYDVVSVSLPSCTSIARISLYDDCGNIVRLLENNRGEHNAIALSELISGIYLCRIECGYEIFTKRLCVVR